ncbi:prepilin-type N-terminal cleavage/methylation domain-containing protein [Rhodoferax sp.]|uniref:pilin n=1 Tax=Rhodoferax sp. TaxID=50421 RepID=UPI002726ADE6|nr:prepilin-type N-terminal cleavage/methylation domain-containing protein [Rhodoferax sp.]MDO9195132.1 prepilin-type N-terminal cleavage/methylation domain-containing protein [Rhodoferax sp.]
MLNDLFRHGFYYFYKVNYMKQVQRGFTLIELVMVIVILGVLAAVAIPKFVDLKGDAAQAAVNGVAGGLSSASAINYASRSIGSVSALANTVAVANCTAVAGAMQGGAMPTGFVITAAPIASGASATCTVTGPTADGSKTATFVAIGI